MADTLQQVVTGITTPESNVVTFKAPKADTRTGVVAEVKERTVKSKKDGHEYVQYIVSLTDGTTYFLPYAISAKAGDPVNIFGESTIANVTGYNSLNEKDGLLDTAHTTTGFSVKSIVVDTEASGQGKARAQAAGKIEAIEALALKYQNNEKMLETIIRLKGII